MMIARFLSFVVLAGGWLTFAIGALTLRKIARQRFEAETHSLPSTYVKGVKSIYRQVNHGRGTEFSEATRNFAENSGQIKRYDTAFVQTVAGFSAFVSGALLLSLFR